MNVQYRNANPGGGNESILLAFEQAHATHTPCILVDAGNGVDLDRSLGEDEYLAAICLTHAHLDHYRSLASALRDGAPVYVGPDTGTVLDDVLREGRDRYGLGDTDAVLDALTPIDGWEPVVEGIEIAPVPAGHAPGAVGFYVAFEDGPETHTIFATGDFTTWRAGGYPGLNPEVHADVDTLICCGATDESFEDALTDAVGTAMRRAQNGSTVLVTASGLTGVHLAYVLGHLADRYDVPTSVTVAGHAARLYDSLDYEIPLVDAVPTFADPDALLAPGAITIAGPEVPVEGSSATLFSAIEDDPGATLIQATGGGSDPVESADCTVADYRLRNHPTEEIVDGVVKSIHPLQVVVTHQRGEGLDRYKDKYTSFVWATDDHRPHTLYDDGFTHPPWMTDTGVRRVKTAHYGSGGSLGGAPDPPAIGRVDDPDLTREGLSFDALVDRYHLNHDPGSTGEMGNGTSETTLADPTAGSAPADPTGVDAGDETRERAATNGGGPPDPDPTTALGTDSLSAVLDRLDRIERVLTREGIRARVVDAGDGVRLLRPLDADLDGLDHGDEVRIALEAVPPRANSSTQADDPTESDDGTEDPNDPAAIEDDEPSQA